MDNSVIIRHIDGITVIMPTDEANWLAKKTEEHIYSQLAYLGVDDSPSNWEEITEEEKKRREENPID